MRRWLARTIPSCLVGLFVLDLLVIHPFEDGNGRVARAVTNALLADAGYDVVRYRESGASDCRFG